MTLPLPHASRLPSGRVLLSYASLDEARARMHDDVAALAAVLGPRLDDHALYAVGRGEGAVVECGFAEPHRFYDLHVDGGTVTVTYVGTGEGSITFATGDAVTIVARDAATAETLPAPPDDAEPSRYDAGPIETLSSAYAAMSAATESTKSEAQAIAEAEAARIETPPLLVKP